MKLAEWKTKNRYTFNDLAFSTGIHPAVLKKISGSGHCVKLTDAMRIHLITDGEVTFADLMPPFEVSYGYPGAPDVGDDDDPCIGCGTKLEYFLEYPTLTNVSLNSRCRLCWNCAKKHLGMVEGGANIVARDWKPVKRSLAK